MKKYASADVIARAFVTACGLTGADPLEIYAPGLSPFDERGAPLVRARYLAANAVLAVMPEISRPALARGLWGFDGNSSNIPQAVRLKWWREDWLDEVVGAILAHFAPETAEGVVRADRTAEEESEAVVVHTPAPVAAAEPVRRGRPSVPLGEPSPGRSALDKRRAGIVEEECEDGRSARRAVSLPRLSFLEKEI